MGDQAIYSNNPANLFMQERTGVYMYYRVAVLLSDNLLATSATLPLEMLRTAEATALGMRLQRPQLVIHGVTDRLEAVDSCSGFSLQPTHTFADCPDVDLVIVPGQWRNPRKALQNSQCLEWLKAQHGAGAIITAVGTGVCFVAATGLLDGKPATTHWHYFDRFQRDFPVVELKRQYFITQAGNIYCTASINSLAEVMIHIIFRWYGRPVANNVERNFFHEIRDSFEPNRYLAEEVESHPDEDILQAQIWMQDNFPRKVSIPAVAGQFGMSIRSFNRRFRSAAGTAPVDYLQSLRLKNARDLLKKTNLSIQEVAAHSGYQDVSYFTRLFSRQFHTTPGQYRETVRAKLFSARKQEA